LSIRNTHHLSLIIPAERSLRKGRAERRGVRPSFATRGGAWGVVRQCSATGKSAAYPFPGTAPALTAPGFAQPLSSGGALSYRARLCAATFQWRSTVLPLPALPR